MDRAAWQATVNGVTRVGRDLAIVMLVMIVINYHHTKKKEKKIQINKIRNEIGDRKTEAQKFKNDVKKPHD